MPVVLGAKPQHGFAEPLGLLSDCHRRIEHFLDVMLHLLQQTNGKSGLSAVEREALEVAVRYFATAAPRHTEDEEASLFPRLRESENPAVLAALVQVESLEADHRWAEAAHAQADRLCRRWLDDGPLSHLHFEELRGVLVRLRGTYARHIAVEDRELLPLAGRVLSQTALTQIGLEMARRRGLH
jgi:hemerythrin-like domain-containing protein